MEQAKRLLVIGGSAYDITASILGTPVPCDSNPSRIYVGAGGVGRNIAENAARMGCDTSFLTAFGIDAFSDAVRASCETVGIDTTASFVFPDESACIYLSILDKAGELQYAASDLTLFERISPQALAEKQSYLRQFPYLLLDANLTEQMLKTVAELTEAELVADAVSVTKALRLRPILPRLAAIKVNRAELAAISGVELAEKKDLQRAAEKLLRAGVKRVFVTMGMEGSCCFTDSGVETCPAFPVQVCNVTGAGDAFTAAMAYGLLRDWENREILLLGTAASHIALQSPYAVSREMSEKTLLETYTMLRKQKEEE